MRLLCLWWAVRFDFSSAWVVVACWLVVLLFCISFVWVGYTSGVWFRVC